MDKLRGHDIEKIDGVWCYSDNKAQTHTEWRIRPCGHCNQHNTPEGHDGCLGTVPGVMNACCGHGVTAEAYVMFDNGEIYQAEIALTMMMIMKILN